MSQPQRSDSIFWIEVEKIRPNPFQPRKTFDERTLEDLADSIRQYGVLQPLTVTRHEEQTESGLQVTYELIAGERRWRASRLAGLTHVPAIIRSGEETDKMKLEIAIIENLQREDLNPIEKAYAFKKLTEEFGLTHAAIGKRMGKSREYVSNALRLLSLPEYIQEAVKRGQITEGHARPLMMLRDQPDEQDTLFKEIVLKKMSVRDAEKIARSVAQDKVRVTTSDPDPTLVKYQKELSENLGTRVSIEKRPTGAGGRIVIDYFSPSDLDTILKAVQSNQKKSITAMMESYEKEMINRGNKQPVSLDVLFGEGSGNSFALKEVDGYLDGSDSDLQKSLSVNRQSDNYNYKPARDYRNYIADVYSKKYNKDSISNLEKTDKTENNQSNSNHQQSNFSNYTTKDEPVTSNSEALVSDDDIRSFFARPQDSSRSIEQNISFEYDQHSPDEYGHPQDTALKESYDHEDWLSRRDEFLKSYQKVAS